MTEQAGGKIKFDLSSNSKMLSSPCETALDVPKGYLWI